VESTDFAAIRKADAFKRGARASCPQQRPTAHLTSNVSVHRGAFYSDWAGRDKLPG